MNQLPDDFENSIFMDIDAFGLEDSNEVKEQPQLPALLQKYSRLNEINSPILNAIFETAEFKEVEHEKFIFCDSHCFSDLYANILALEKGQALDFWKDNQFLVNYLDSPFLDYYYSIHIKNETIKDWLKQKKKNRKLLEYAFTHCSYDFLKERGEQISKIFGNKWTVYKKVKYANELQNMSDYLKLRTLEICIGTYSLISISNQLTELNQLTNLKHVEIHCSRITSLEGFPNLQHLEHLSICGQDFNSFSHFPDFPNLNRLTIFDCPISSFQHFPNLQNLEDLNITGTELASFQYFPNLPKLKYLYLDRNKFNSFDYFPNLPNLRGLDLNNSRITSFFCLPNMRNLVGVSFCGNQLSSFENFPNFDKLEMINISKNQFNSFEHLPLLAKLDCLIFHYNEIPENHIRELQQRFPGIVHTFSSS